MIKDGKLLVIERFDVRRQTFGVPATEWTPEDLMSKSFDLMRFSEIAMGIDENLNTVVKIANQESLYSLPGHNPMGLLSITEDGNCETK